MIYFCSFLVYLISLFHLHVIISVYLILSLHKLHLPFARFPIRLRSVERLRDATLSILSNWIRYFWVWSRFAHASGNCNLWLSALQGGWPVRNDKQFVKTREFTSLSAFEVFCRLSFVRCSKKVSLSLIILWIILSTQVRLELFCFRLNIGWKCAWYFGT